MFLNLQQNILGIFSIFGNISIIGVGVDKVLLLWLQSSKSINFGTKYKGNHVETQETCDVMLFSDRKFLYDKQ